MYSAIPAPSDSHSSQQFYVLDFRSFLVFMGVGIKLWVVSGGDKVQPHHCTLNLSPDNNPYHSTVRNENSRWCAGTSSGSAIIHAWSSNPGCDRIMKNTTKQLLSEILMTNSIHMPSPF